MFRQCTALILLLAFVASTFSKAVIVVDFYANQDNIYKSFCENRDKPMVHCYGRCQLKKRLARENNQDKSNPERRAGNKQQVLSSENPTSLNTYPLRNCITKRYSSGPNIQPIDRAGDIFHPPA